MTYSIGIILLVLSLSFMITFLYLRYKKHRHRYLVFSSADERNNIHFWTSDPSKKNFDLAIYYFGEDENPEFQADYIFKRKGLKFDNFYHFIKHNNISQYEAIWVVDDDIIIDTSSINKMFTLFSRYNLWLAQPSFINGGRISWNITQKHPDCILRFTNFVENGVTVYSSKILPQLMETFKDARTGFGVDLIWPKLLGYPKNKIAIIDAISCSHPKGNHSSLDKVVPREQHLTQGVELLKDFGLLPQDCEPLQYKTWDMLYDSLPDEVKFFREYSRIT